MTPRPKLQKCPISLHARTKLTGWWLGRLFVTRQGMTWYDRSGNECADKCAWTFGALSTASNGARYNVVLGGTPEYLTDS